jgi:hypothetical protein
MQQDLYRVQYDTNRNGFITCAFQQPVVVQAGNYYIGITQPANFGSDSIYYGLDVNTQQNAQQLFYNVDGTWYGSSTPGTIMMRLLCGAAVVSTGVESYTNTMPDAWYPYPNPCTDVLHLPKHIEYTSLQCVGIDGRQWPIKLSSSNTINMLELPRGVYILRATNKQQRVYEARIIHQ